jgi:hypothetical protein
MNNLLTLPASALETADFTAEPEEGEKRPTIQPEVGDPVTFSVRGTVKAITNGVATIHVAFVDGKRVEIGDEDDVPGEGDEEGSLRKMAEQADSNGGMD